jgi:hypothetical protein
MVTSCPSMPPLQFISLKLIQDASSMVFQPLYAQAADIFGGVMQETGGARLAIMGSLPGIDILHHHYWKWYWAIYW